MIKKDKLFVCPECGSMEVDTQRWANANTHELGDDTERYCFCNNCDTEFDYEDLEYVDIAETYEAKEIARILADLQLLPAEDRDAAAAEALLEELQEHLDEYTYVPNPTPQVIITIEGGNFQGGVSEIPIDLKVMDWDDHNVCVHGLRSAMFSDDTKKSLRQTQAELDAIETEREQLCKLTATYPL